jgi:hypothetical protein
MGLEDWSFRDITKRTEEERDQKQSNLLGSHYVKSLN